MSDDPTDPREKFVGRMAEVAALMERTITRLEAMHASIDEADA